jgi:hypothetical protein
VTNVETGLLCALQQRVLFRIFTGFPFMRALNGHASPKRCKNTLKNNTKKADTKNAGLIFNRV